MAWGGLADSNMGKRAASSSEDHALALGVTGSRDTDSLYAVWTEVSSGTGLIVRS
jgi:hypothetical protein